MLIPNPILFDVPPEGGAVILVTPERGGLAGYILLGLTGPEATVEVSIDDGATWEPVAYPHTLAPGEQLRLSRTDTSAGLSVLRALAPVDLDDLPPLPEPPAAGLTVTTDSDDYLTSDDPRITTDPDGYLSAPDELIQADSDGYFSEATL